MSHESLIHMSRYIPFGKIRRLIALFTLLHISACSSLVYQPSKKLFYDPQDLGFSKEDVYFDSLAGTRLQGWFFPAAPGRKQLGTVVQFHGNAENISTHFLSLAWLTGEGYNLFTFDYSGYGRSEGYPGQARLNGDALAAIQYALNIKRDRLNALSGEGVEKEHKLFLYGQSLGGAVLLRALHDVAQKDEIDGIIIESSFTSYREMAREKLSLTCLTWPLQPLAYLFSDEYAPINTMESLPAIPLLVIHGDRDLIVPIHHGEKIFSLASEPKEMWRVEGGRHIDAMLRSQYREKLLRYMMGI